MLVRVAGKSLMAMGLSLVAYLLIYAGAIHLLVKRPDGSAYGFGRGLSGAKSFHQYGSADVGAKQQEPPTRDLRFSHQAIRQ